MSRYIPDGVVLLGAGTFGVNERVRSADWQALIHAQNRVWCDLGMELPGRGSRSADGFYQTTSTTYTQDNDLDQEGIADWCAGARVRRALNSTPAALMLRWRAFLEQGTVRLTVADITGNAVLGTLELSATTAGWASGVLSIPRASLFVGANPRQLGLYLEAKAASGQTCKLFQFHGHAYRLVTGDEALLPDGS